MSETSVSPAGTTAKGSPKPIRVKQLRTLKAVDCPARGMTETITDGLMGRTTTVIQYEPWLRHHRVTVKDSGTTYCIMIPETTVSSWVPFEYLAPVSAALV